MTIGNINHLDCTLRDGGYYNSWNFSENLVQDYLNVMSKSQVNYVELGFRFLKVNGFYGPTAFTKESYINSFKVPSNINLAVMINGSDLLGTKKFVSDLISNFFVKKKFSKIKLVRIACHFKEIDKVLVNAMKFKKLGYEVGINLMQISEEKDDSIERVINKVSKFKPKVIYFADSVGSLTPERTEKIVKIAKKQWKGDIGFHTHDNLSLAMLNSLSAIRAGAKWIDTTVTGMGRGPGNTKTEYFLIERSKNNKNIKLNYITNLITNYFSKLKLKYQWGTNSFYYLAGINKIHPTYIQEMLNDNRYDNDQKLFIINNLKNNNSRFYNKNFFENNSIFFSKKYNEKSTFLKKKLSNKNFLILGNGMSVTKNKLYIEKYIKKYNPVVLSSNMKKNIDEKLIDFRLICNPYRIISEINEIKKNKKKIIMPKKLLEICGLKNSANKIFNFDLNLGKKFNISKNSCTLSKPLVLFYALAIVNNFSAKEIYCAGFDGEKDSENIIDAINKFLDKYNKNKKYSKLKSLTSSRYNLNPCPLYKKI